MPLIDLHTHYPMHTKFPPAFAKGPPPVGNEVLFWAANMLLNFQAGKPRVSTEELLAGSSGGAGSVLYDPEDEFFHDATPVPEAFAHLQAQMANVEEEVCGTQGRLQIACNPVEVEAFFRSGQRFLFHCIEGAFAFAGDEKNVDVIAPSGIAYVTVAHLFYRGVATCENALPFVPDVVFDHLLNPQQDRNCGLTSLGKRIVAKLMENQILVDITHSTQLAQKEIFDMAGDYKVPVICSHNGVRGASDYPLNLTKDAILRIKDRKGVIGVIFYPHWLRQPGEQLFGPDGFDLLFRAIDRIHDITGTYEHVAIGSDLDGFIQPIKGCETYSKTPDLEAAVRSRYPEDADRILFGNALDVLHRGWRGRNQPMSEPINSAATQPHPTRQRKMRHLAALQDSPIVGRFTIVNQFHRVASQLAATSNFPRLKAFLPWNWGWAARYLKYLFTKKYPFQTYEGNPINGVYPIGPSAGAAIKIAVAGDWGTGTNEANTVARLMDAWNPDFTIHLGDVYYVGDDDEINENCLGKPTNEYAPVYWSFGTQGSFALNGNHEMYAKGKPYFTTFLSKLGMRTAPGSASFNGQFASFFCLESEHWRIIGLDTGYNSDGWPIIGVLPAFGGDCKLEDDLIAWMRDVVKVQEHPKATLLLSHHQYYSAFDDFEYPKQGQQLKEFFGDQEVVWLWGHEHRLVIYKPMSQENGVRAYGRCVGHGGMPVEIKGPKKDKKDRIDGYDIGQHPIDDQDNTQVGYNGYVQISIDGAVMDLEYLDLNKESLCREKFTAGAGGALTYQLISINRFRLKPGAESEGIA